MLTLVTGTRLVLIRHAMPDVQLDVPARDWHLGDDGRVAARNLSEMVPAHAYLVASDEPKAAWEPHSSVVRRFHAAVARLLAVASGRGEAVVIGTHGMAMTMWICGRVRCGEDPSAFWTTLDFADAIVVDLKRRKYQRSL